jgi:hypothetical protein
MYKRQLVRAVLESGFSLLMFLSSTMDKLVWDGGSCYVSGYYTDDRCSVGKSISRFLPLILWFLMVPANQSINSDTRRVLNRLPRMPGGQEIEPFIVYSDALDCQ